MKEEPGVTFTGLIKKSLFGSLALLAVFHVLEGLARIFIASPA